MSSRRHRLPGNHRIGGICLSCGDESGDVDRAAPARHSDRPAVGAIQDSHDVNRAVASHAVRRRGVVREAHVGVVALAHDHDARA